RSRRQGRATRGGSRSLPRARRALAHHAGVRGESSGHAQGAGAEGMRPDPRRGAERGARDHAQRTSRPRPPAGGDPPAAVAAPVRARAGGRGTARGSRGRVGEGGPARARPVSVAQPAVIFPNRPCDSPSGPAVKKSVFVVTLSVSAALPNYRAQTPAIAGVV